MTETCPSTLSPRLGEAANSAALAKSAILPLSHPERILCRSRKRICQMLSVRPYGNEQGINIPFAPLPTPFYMILTLHRLVNNMEIVAFRPNYVLISKIVL
jgi:hypothetical protein